LSALIWFRGFVWSGWFRGAIGGNFFRERGEAEDAAGFSAAFVRREAIALGNLGANVILGGPFPKFLLHFLLCFLALKLQALALDGQALAVEFGAAHAGHVNEPLADGLGLLRGVAHGIEAKELRDHSRQSHSGHASGDIPGEAFLEGVGAFAEGLERLDGGLFGHKRRLICSRM
jgi:hypothetical protein